MQCWIDIFDRLTHFLTRGRFDVMLLGKSYLQDRRFLKNSVRGRIQYETDAFPAAHHYSSRPNRAKSVNYFHSSVELP